MDELEKQQLLKSIQLEGDTTNKNIRVLIANKIQGSALLNLSSGLPSIKSYLKTKFQLILNQPLSLSALSSLEIRCCLCSKVINYPAWYYVTRYNINEFHYFVCFNGDSSKANARCYKAIQ
jgi:hypothetical protein